MPSPLASRAVLEGVRPFSASVRESRAPKIERYARDPLLPLHEGRIKVWDPDLLAFVPFEVWPSQEELVRAWIDCERLVETGELRLSNTHVEKSRQMGDTVICAYACLWIVTYHDAPLLVQHQDLREVADAAPPTWDSFFGKIRLMWEEWPAEIGRANLRVTVGNSPLIRNASHPQRFLVGEGQTPDPGRGGRYAGAVVDEAARIRYDIQAQAALSRACPTGRLMLSTPKGEGNVYFRLRQTRPAGWTFLRHHWSSHPVYGRGQHVAGEDPSACDLCRGTVEGVPFESRRPLSHRFPGKLTSPWYDAAVLELTDEQVAEELDIDYAGALTGRVFKSFDEETHTRPEIPFDPALPLELAWDYGIADPTAVVLIQDGYDCVRVVGEFEQIGLTPEEVAAGLREAMRRIGVPERLTDPSWTRRMPSVGDPAGEQTSLATGRPLTADYARLGFRIQSRQQPVSRTINAVRRLLLGRPKPLLVSRAAAPLFVSHMKSNVWPTGRDGRVRPGAPAPLNDEHNHMCRAFAYWACFKYPPPEDALGEDFDPLEHAYQREGRIDPGLSYDLKL